MPLDYSVWCEIVKKMIATAPKRVETKEAFLFRIENIAQSLPEGYVKSVIRHMHESIQALVEADGYTPNKD